ncbi:MAG: M23 family metallopeptidase [Pseudomonadota bacterium]
MQSAQFYKKNTNNSAVGFPKSHIALCAVMFALILSTYFSIPGNSYSFSGDDQIYIPLEFNFDQLAVQLNEAEESNNPESVASSSQTNYNDWEKIKISKGDNLQIIFRQLQIPSEEYHLLWKYSRKILGKLNPKQELVVQFSDNKRIEAVRFKKSILESYTFVRKDETYIRKDKIREPRIRYQHHIIQVNGSLGNSLSSTIKGLNTKRIRSQITSALSPRVNLETLKKNDIIHILTEEKYIDDQSLGYNNVLAAQFNGRGINYTAYRYKTLDGSVAYYSPKVSQKYKTVKRATTTTSSRPSFLRSPVPGARISSHFSHNRLHPILKVRRPHLGTDYAARTGTPVRAVGPGKVIASAYARGNGNYIVLQHGHIKTKYLHLHRRYVSKGQTVKRGQSIGTVGSTGLSTGAHLHYELIVNGRHQNPLHIARYTPKSKYKSKRYTEVQVAVKTPGAIPSNERKRFFEQTRGIRMQFSAATRKGGKRVSNKSQRSKVEVANIDKNNTRHN